MKELSKESVIRFVGIDLAKRSVHLYAVDGEGRAVRRRKLTRARLRAVVAQLPACTMAMEACGRAHHWARLFRTFGHEVRLIAPQFVKPYVKSNKNDAADAEAIGEAAQRPGMRFVAVKTLEQQDIQAIHRMRSLAVQQRPRRSTRSAACCWNTASKLRKDARRSTGACRRSWRTPTTG